MRIKALLLLAVCMAVVIGAELPGSGVEKVREQNAASTERTALNEVGVSVTHPKEWFVEREKFTYDDTYGYTLWRPEFGTKDAEGGSPEVRVALAYGMEPKDIEATVRDKIADHPDVPMKRERVYVGKKRLKGVAVGPIPGSTPSTEVYVSSAGRVYQVNVYGERLDTQGRKLLSTLSFAPPPRSASSLDDDLKDGKKAESFWAKDVDEPSEEERAARGRAAVRAAEAVPAEPGTRSASATRSTSATAEYQIAEGCYMADSRVYFQTQHGSGANASPYDGIPTGFTVVGRPNYWGQYTHGSLGYGRCASTYYTNDKFAIDYPLNRGNVVFSPFSKGTVVFAGRNYSHKNYGLFVVIRDPGGRYVSMSAHLNSLASGIYKGKTVYASTVIGYAGNTGDPSIPVGEVHLHQAFYRYPSLKTDGSPYGGRGLQVVYHRYVGVPGVRAGGVYTFAPQRGAGVRSKGNFISN